MDIFPTIIDALGLLDTVNLKVQGTSLLQNINNDYQSEEAVYIGDMEEDVLAAKAARVISIFIKGKGKENYNSDYTVNSISEIPKLLSEKI